MPSPLSSVSWTTIGVDIDAEVGIALQVEAALMIDRLETVRDEIGQLARDFDAMAERIEALVNSTLSTLGADKRALFSTLGRTASVLARGEGLEAHARSAEYRIRGD